MEYILDYLKEEMFIEPVANATIDLDEEFEGEVPIGFRLIINGKDVDIVVWHADYSNWIEKKFIELHKQENGIL